MAINPFLEKAHAKTNPFARLGFNNPKVASVKKQVTVKMPIISRKTKP
jgi:hypothetical protein